MSEIVSQITGKSAVCSKAGSGKPQSKHQSLTSPACCEWTPPLTGEFPHKGPKMRKIFPWCRLRPIIQRLFHGILFIHDPCIIESICLGFDMVSCFGNPTDTINYNVEVLYPLYCTTWWHRERERLSALVALCEGNELIMGGFLNRAGEAKLWCFLLLFLLLAWTYCSRNDTSRLWWRHQVETFSALLALCEFTDEHTME